MLNFDSFSSLQAFCFMLVFGGQCSLFSWHSEAVYANWCMQVIKLLEKEGIQWSEENRGTVLVKLDGYREFSFLDSDDDTE